MQRLRKFVTVNNVILVLLAILSLSWAWSTIGALQKNYALQKQVDQGRLDNEVLELQNQNLQLQQAYYKTDEFQELEARAKLNKALPGENLVVLPKHTATRSTDETAVAEVDSQTNGEKWAEFLFGGKRR